MITKLKIAIDESGMKQVYIAKKIGVDYTLLSKWVRGERTPPEPIARELAKILRVRISDL